MKWCALIQSVEVLCAGGEGNPQITDVAFDSRRVGPGSVFVAVAGVKADGDRYVAAAIEAGACAIVSHRAQHQCAVPWIQVKDPRTALGLLSRKLWADGYCPATAIGITGTNGKTTTAELFHGLMTEHYGEVASWQFGTMAYRYDGRRMEATHTTPEAADIFRMIGKATTKPEAIVMEVSSHALQLDRVAGLRYDVGVFTNLTQDHFEFHHTMEAYYEAKRKLFMEYLSDKGCAVVNVDDRWGRTLLADLDGTRVITYGEADEADVRIAEWQTGWKGSRIVLAVADHTIELRSGLVGAFNRYNLAAFCAGGRALGYTAAQMQAALDKVSIVAGRLERVAVEAGFTVAIDYAHTPDALEKVLVTAGELTAGRLIVVFGCGGDRDRRKRPLMAEAVAHHCDEAIVTSDNPRSESPEAIIEEVVAGMPLDFAYSVEVEREKAIRAALELAQKGDCVIIAGKGHETYQEVNGVKHPFDDKEVAIRQYVALMGEG